MFLNENDSIKKLDKLEGKNVAGFSPLGGEVYRTPRFDMQEEQKKYIIYMEIPGSHDESIKTKIDHGMLLVSAEISKETADKTMKYLHRERHIRSYKHEVMLPTDADIHSLKNEYKNGLLIVTVDKKKN